MNNLPQYWSVSTGSMTRTGNVFTVGADRERYISITLAYIMPVNSVALQPGDHIIMNFNSGGWTPGSGTNATKCRIYINPEAITGGDAAADSVIWYAYAGSWQNAETVMNTSARSNSISFSDTQTGDKYIEFVVTRELRGVTFYIGWVASGGSANAYAHDLTWTFINAGTPPPTDPYSELDVPTSTTGGGPNSPTNPVGYDGIINDDIDFPDTPTASAANANFISIWTPTLDQVQDLAKWMWTTDPLRWEFWQKLLQNPLELIFSLTIMPIPIYHTNESGTPAEDEIVASSDVLCLGWQDTGIMMDWITDQYITLDMGSINIEEVWGAFLDYEPYTKIDIFLPYIGMKTLDTNDCMPRTISLKYKIDLATGTCLALIKCDNSVYYHFSGNCASQIPITVNQCQEIVRGLMTMAVGAATLVAGGAGVAAAGETTAVSGLTTAGGAAMMGRGADNAAKGVSVSRSGTICCAAGLMDVQTPYLVISRPRQALPEEQNKYTGYPSFITEQIGDLEGYTEVQIIHLENMTCTDEEYQEIDTLLLGGVII